jgi:hypothetical protein
MRDKEWIKLKKWRRMEFGWFLLFILLGAGVTYVIYRSRLDLNHSEVIGLLLGTWGAIITFIIARLKNIVEKQEKLVWGSGSRDKNANDRFVTHQDKQEVNSLILQQCQNEMRLAQEKMNDARSLVFRAGDTELALQIREIEKRIGDMVSKINTPGFPSPYYLSDTPVRESEWSRILDREEEILVIAKNLGVITDRFHLAAPQVALTDLRKVEQLALHLIDQLHARSRIV